MSFPDQQQDLPTARPSKQLLDTPRAAARQGWMFALITVSVVTFTLPKSPTPVA